MAQIIDGKAVSRAVRARVAQETLALKEQGVTPGLAVILVGEDAQNAAAIKAHPLLARLQLGGGLSTVGYASVRDTAAINKIMV